MKLTKRELLHRTLFGAGYVGLQSLATGIPAAFLASPSRAMAQAAACPNRGAAQFLVLCTSNAGEPVNANVPGTYADPAIVHANDPSMAATTMQLGNRSAVGAQIWSTLPQWVLNRTCFFHHATFTNSHSNQLKVLRLMGETAKSECIPTIFSKYLQGCLNTIQVEPLSVGSQDALTFEARPLPNVTPSSLKNVLTQPGGALSKLQAMRDRKLDEIYALLKKEGTTAQRKYLDEVAISRGQARSISTTLLNNLSSIQDDGTAGQLTAVVTLIQMKVSPVMTMTIDFGGDNHADPGMMNYEVPGHTTGVGYIAQLMSELKAANIQDNVTFGLLSVFGRTLSSQGMVGRTHWANHHAGILIGSKVNGGVVGGLEPMTGGDFSATSIDSRTGASIPQGAGDIPFADTLGSYAKTMGTVVGVPSDLLESNIRQGKVVAAAVAA